LRRAIRRRYDRALNKWRCNRTYVYRIVNGSQIRFYNLTKECRNTNPALRRNAFNRGALSNAKADRHRLVLRFGVARHAENLAMTRVNRKRRRLASCDHANIFRQTVDNRRNSAHSRIIKREEPTMLNAKQIKWASDHDWFCESYDWFISVWDRSYDRQTQTETRQLRYFYDFQMLRDWAGY
jgi:hypothetical protein